MKTLCSFADFVNESAVFTNDITRNHTIIQQAIKKANAYLTDDEPLGGEEFMTEIAMVESHLATQDGTVRTSGSAGRGAWQIDKVGFDAARDSSSHPGLQVYLDRLKKKGVDMDKVQWDDCNQPFYGALAARLILLSKPFQIGKTVAERAKQWKQHYNSLSGAGSTKEYLQRVDNCYKELGVHTMQQSMSVPKPQQPTETGGMVNFIKNKGKQVTVKATKPTPYKPDGTGKGLVNFINKN